MSAAKSIVEGETYRRLADAVEGAAVYQDPPENAPYPLVIIGDLRSVRPGGKGADGDRIVTITIVTLVEAQERAPLLRLQEQIEKALDAQTFETSDGWTLAYTFQDDDAVLDEDGATYAGLTVFTVVALQP